MVSTSITDSKEEIRQLKLSLHKSFDITTAFSAMDKRLDASIASIKNDLAAGRSPIPEVSYSDIQKGSFSPQDLARLKSRGVCVIRGVFAHEEVVQWNDQIMSYIVENNYFDKQKAKAQMDKYFSTLASDKPQIFDLYWSGPQMRARTSPELAEVRCWLNRLWRYETETGPVFDPNRECLYADRLRQRQPGDATLGLSPHVDGGSVERWLDSGFRSVYRHVFAGEIDSYDPFDASYRADTKEIPSPAVCSAFRTYQGWTALSPQGPGDGTLNLIPIAEAMGWILLRALLKDIAEDDLCGAEPARAMLVSKKYHTKLLDVYGPIPKVAAGDTVWWHPDVIHGVEDKHSGNGYSNVMYIGAAPDCAKNRAYLKRLRPAFEDGRSAPDFAAKDFEVDFAGRFTKDQLSPLGRLQMGYEA